MTGKQAIEQLLKAQRTGGAVAPEVGDCLQSETSLPAI